MISLRHRTDKRPHRSISASLPVSSPLSARPSGAIGTALAAVLTNFLVLSWWEMPLAVGGLMLLVSGPSMITGDTWKLRGSATGPILDANGWAVSPRASTFRSARSPGTAELPSVVRSSMRDPFADETPMEVLPVSW